MPWGRLIRVEKVVGTGQPVRVLGVLPGELVLQMSHKVSKTVQV